jgi:hypothetical protein
VWHQSERAPASAGPGLRTAAVDDRADVFLGSASAPLAALLARPQARTHHERAEMGTCWRRLHFPAGRALCPAGLHPRRPQRVPVAGMHPSYRAARARSPRHRAQAHIRPACCRGCARGWRCARGAGSRRAPCRSPSASPPWAAGPGPRRPPSGAPGGGGGGPPRMCSCHVCCICGRLWPGLGLSSASASKPGRSWHCARRSATDSLV